MPKKIRHKKRLKNQYQCDLQTPMRTKWTTAAKKKPAKIRKASSSPIYSPEIQRVDSMLHSMQDAYANTTDTILETFQRGFQNTISVMTQEFRTEIHLLKQETLDKVHTLENKIKEMSQVIEEQKKDIASVQEENEILRSKSQIWEGRMTRNERDLAHIKEDILQLTTRQMRENLIFHNIEEHKTENPDQAKEILLNFMKKDMKMSETVMKTIKLDRVHRTGKHSE